MTNLPRAFSLLHGYSTNASSASLRSEFATERPAVAHPEILMTEKAKTIIFAHGIGNKPKEDVLKCQWDRALFGFELGERSRLAYWVNRVFYPNPSPVTCQSGDKTRVGEQSGDIEIKAVAVQNTEAVLEAEIETLAENKEQRQFLERVKNELLKAEKLDPGSVADRRHRAEGAPLAGASAQLVHPAFDAGGAARCA